MSATSPLGEQLPPIDYVIYHADCPDGLTAAWVIWHDAMKGNRSAGVEFHGWTHGTPAPHVPGRSVAIVDFSFRRAEMQQLLDEAAHVLVLDHHKSAQSELVGLAAANLTLIFDMERSGAQMACDYFHAGEQTPWFVSYVQDADLWQWRLDSSRQVATGMKEAGCFNFEALEALYEHTEEALEFMYEHEGSPTHVNDFNAFVKHGVELLRCKKRQVLKYVQEARRGTLLTPGGTLHRVRFVSCPFYLIDDVGNEIVAQHTDCAFAVIWNYELAIDQWVCCLRAGSNDVDLGKVAREWQTGVGHPKAAGFRLLPGTHLREHLQSAAAVQK